jgi:hypothetical protein
MIRVKNILVIIVLTSVELVMASTLSRKPKFFDDQHEILSSTNQTRESAPRHLGQSNVLAKRVLTKHFYLKPLTMNSDLDHDNENLPLAVETDMR